MTYGDQLDELPKEYIDIYKQVFPPLNVAGRPLDIWENQPYTLWGMQPALKDDSYCLFGVFDLDDKGKRNININLDEVLSRSTGWKEIDSVPGKYLLWDFWNEKLLESDAYKIELIMPHKSCRLFALRKYKGVPQLLGTNGYFSMGYTETRNLDWNDSEKALSGFVKGNGGDATDLFFYLPENFAIQNINLNNQRIQYSIQNKVLKVNVPPSDEMKLISLKFKGNAGNVELRSFVKGDAAKRY